MKKFECAILGLTYPRLMIELGCHFSLAIRGLKKINIHLTLLSLNKYLIYTDVDDINIIYRDKSCNPGLYPVIV